MSEIIIAIFILLMMFFLLGYLFYLYGSKNRAQKIEKRGQIPFMDEPLEEK